MENYKVDGSGRHINLMVDVGTNGIAVTTAFIKVDGSSEIVAESADGAGGDIPYDKIGINRKLSGLVLNIRVAIRLTNIPQDKWQDEVKNSIVMKAYIKGGPEGEKEFLHKIYEIDDTDLPKVFITKRIEFTS